MLTIVLRSSLIGIVVVCTLSSAKGVDAPSLPSNFVGQWWPISSDAAACPSPLPESYHDTILTVTPSGFAIFEAAYCEILSLQTFEDSVIKADFECVGMTDLWNDRIVMRVGELGTQRMLTIASMSMTNHRDDSGNMLPNDPAPGVGIWIKCEDSR